MFKILSFDGGGIRSVFQARIIERIESSLGGQLAFDMVAGTSAGSIVAAGIQVKPAAEIREFFESRSPEIFRKEPFFREIDDLWNLTEAKYGNLELKSNLIEVFSDLTLGDLPQKTLITSFNLKADGKFWQPVVFQNLGGVGADPSLRVVDAIMRSAAAPTYLPVYQNHCDGGVWGNNPSMSALAASIDEYVGRQNLANCVLLSIGTGRKPAGLLSAKRDLGAFDWYKNRIFDLLMDGNTDASHYYVRSLLNTRYYRMQLELPREIKLDDSAAISDMLEYADHVDLRPLFEWMGGFWN